jgi:hypothetical protein
MGFNRMKKPTKVNCHSTKFQKSIITVKGILRNHSYSVLMITGISGQSKGTTECFSPVTEKQAGLLSTTSVYRQNARVTNKKEHQL